jgi:hypothetical protein
MRCSNAVKHQIMWENSDFWISLAVLLGGSGLVAAMYWLEKRPRKNLKPRLFPTTLVLLLGLLIALGAGVHLLGYLGIHPPTQR